MKRTVLGETSSAVPGTSPPGPFNAIREPISVAAPSGSLKMTVTEVSTPTWMARFAGVISTTSGGERSTVWKRLVKVDNAHRPSVSVMPVVTSTLISPRVGPGAFEGKRQSVGGEVLRGGDRSRPFAHEDGVRKGSHRIR